MIDKGEKSGTSLCERGIDCLECESRGMCNSYANFKYQQGRADEREDGKLLLAK